MVSTRSNSQKIHTTNNAQRNKVIKKATKTLAKVTSAEPWPRDQRDDYDKNLRLRLVNFKIVSKTRSSDKNLEVDEGSYLALGVYIESLKKERLKNDPTFVPTREFYCTAMRDFNSLTDDNKAVYIAEAKKRNSIDNDVAECKRAVDGFKVTNPSLLNSTIEGDASALYFTVKKNDPDYSFDGDYGAGKVSYMHLEDDDRAPYCAVALLRLVDIRAEKAKIVAKFGIRALYEEFSHMFQNRRLEP